MKQPVVFAVCQGDGDKSVSLHKAAASVQIITRPWELRAAVQGQKQVHGPRVHPHYGQALVQICAGKAEQMQGVARYLPATVLENSMTLNLVVTTASKPLGGHLIEKFGRVGSVATPGGRAAPLRVIELDGNGRTGVRLQTVY